MSSSVCCASTCSICASAAWFWRPRASTSSKVLIRARCSGAKLRRPLVSMTMIFRRRGRSASASSTLSVCSWSSQTMMEMSAWPTHVGHFGRWAGGIHPHGDGPDQARAHLRQHPFDAVFGNHAHMAARGQAQRQQAQAEVAGALGSSRPR